MRIQNTYSGLRPLLLLLTVVTTLWAKGQENSLVSFKHQPAFKLVPQVPFSIGEISRVTCLAVMESIKSSCSRCS